MGKDWIRWFLVGLLILMVGVLLVWLGRWTAPEKVETVEIPVEVTKIVEKEVLVEKVITVTVPITVAVEAPTEGVVYAAELEVPDLFDADSCPPEENPNGCSLDVGVNYGQVGVVFGWHVKWPSTELDAGGNGCNLVILRSGWYENLWFLDGRYEVYDVPSADHEGCIEVLATQRANEQAANYGCPEKDFEDIPQWTSSVPSPPISEPTATPTSTTCERQATGQNASLPFEAGEAVYGWKIELAPGEVCDGGECYLPNAPASGVVTSGVINPWPAEVQGVTPWEP